MALYDVTRPLSPDTPVYPGDPPVVMICREQGMYHTTYLELTTHAGTHIDAPSHSIGDGDTIDRVPFTHLLGLCRVLDFPSGIACIKKDDLTGRLNGIKRLFFKTDASAQTQFDQHFPTLSKEAAQELCDIGIVCVGIDSPSLEAYHSDGSIHRLLLSKGIVLIELLDLSRVSEGDYWMIALPLRLQGLDGSPARIILMDIDEVNHDSYH